MVMEGNPENAEDIVTITIGESNNRKCLILYA